MDRTYKKICCFPSMTYLLLHECTICKSTVLIARKHCVLCTSSVVCSVSASCAHVHMISAALYLPRQRRPMSECDHRSYHISLMPVTVELFRYRNHLSHQTQLRIVICCLVVAKHCSISSSLEVHITDRLTVLMQHMVMN